uniref:Pc85, similar to Td38,pallidipin-like salivary lipocalin n=1 Tax=Panstrongylus chinai TaxID=156444 RepID=A0A286P0V8_9HEMI|nr:Pc85, similar to Td38,pallidipin-like salivary lipocalin [Panstrongylus chinai]
MKTIIAVTFIGILTYACDEKSSERGPTECNVTAMANFDSEKYLKFFPAYTTHSKYKGLTVCRLFKSATKSCDTADTTIIGYYQLSDVGGIQNYEMVCSTSEEEYKKGQFFTECKTVKDSLFGDLRNSLSIKIYMSVDDTDYENYAIRYNCIKEEKGILDNYEVLQKNPTACGEINELIKEALNKRCENFDEFISMNTTYCQKHDISLKKEK